MEETDPDMMVATCRTEGCVAEGIHYKVPMFPNVDPPTYRAVCAQCGQAVTDLVPA
ncbi:hypothetical protein [Streptomyces sp. NPDC048157]|uniref:hypothetical protein n=1 Tax=Streptomyces sp. NPDC048157 TaxID=3365503 RepID=UPI003724B153